MTPASSGRARRTSCAIRPIRCHPSSTTSRSASGQFWALRGDAFFDSPRRDPRSDRPERLRQDDAFRVLRRRLARHARRRDARRRRRSQPTQRKHLLFFVPDGIRPWPDQTVDWVAAVHRGPARAPRDARRRRVASLWARTARSARDSASCRRASIGACCSRSACSRRTRCSCSTSRSTGSISARRATSWRCCARTPQTDRTLFLSIHQLGDAARICDRFVLLSGGRVAGEGTLDELRARAGLAAQRRSRGGVPCPHVSGAPHALAAREGVSRARGVALVLAAAARDRRARRPRVHDGRRSCTPRRAASAADRRRSSQGLSPLEGIVVPTLGAYDLAATLLFPFVVIRLVAVGEADRRARADAAVAGVDSARRSSRRASCCSSRGSSRGSPAASALLLWRGDGRTSVRAGDVDGRPRPPAARRA